MKSTKTKKNWADSLTRAPEKIEKYRPKVEEVQRLQAEAKAKGKKLTDQDACDIVKIPRATYATYKRVILNHDAKKKKRSTRASPSTTVNPPMESVNTAQKLNERLDQMLARLEESSKKVERLEGKSQEQDRRITLLEGQNQILAAIIRGGQPMRTVAPDGGDPSVPRTLSYKDSG